MGGDRGRVASPVEPRFWSKVRKGDGCWEWQGARYTPPCLPYGAFGVGSRRDNTKRQVAAHRFSWMLHNGPIPPGMQVCHRCDNPPCVRPDHLFLGTAKDNQDDKVAKRRQAHGSRTAAALLNESQVIEIKARLARGETYARLALEYGVKHGAIGKIARGESWRYVGSECAA